MKTPGIKRHRAPHICPPTVRDLATHPAFEDFGNLLLTRENNTPYYDLKLADMRRMMPYHGHVRPDVSLRAGNHLIDEIDEG